MGGGRNDDPRGDDSQRRRGRGWAGGGEQGAGRGPLAGVGEGQKREGRHEAGDSRGFGSQRKCTGGGRAEGESVVLARLRFELEILPDRHGFGADVAIAGAALAAESAISRDKFDRRGEAGGLDAHHQAVGLVEGDGVKAQHRARAEQRIADFVEHGAGAVARGDAGGLVQPFRAEGGLDAEA